MVQPDDLAVGQVEELDDDGSWVGLRRHAVDEFHVLRDYDGSRDNITVWIRSASTDGSGWRVDRLQHQLGEHFVTWDEALRSAITRSREALKANKPAPTGPPKPPFIFGNPEESSFSPLASDDRKEQRRWAREEAERQARDEPSGESRPTDTV